MRIDLDNFQKIYYEKSKLLEEEFETEKSIVHIQIVIITIITIVIGMFSYIAAFRTDSMVLSIFFSAVIISVLCSSAIIKKFTNRVKKNIFPELFKSIDNNLIYNGTKKYGEIQFIESGLFESYNCSYSSQDCITTKVDENNVVIYELEVKTSNGNRNSTIFEGLFLNIVLDKPLKSDMKIIYNSSKDFGIIKTLFKNEDKVNLENIDFEKRYDVYCPDQIYARKILTLIFMEKLLNAANKFNTEIQISFKNNNIFMTIPGLQLINDSDLYSKKIDMISIAKDIDNILEIIDTVHDLNLDEKIE